jgi:hypothetical protein
MSFAGPFTIEKGKNVLKTGGGTLTISGAQDHAPASSLDVEGGTVNLGSNAGHTATAAAPAGANLTVRVGSPGSTVNLRTDQDLNDLYVNWADPGIQKVDLETPAGPGAYRSVHMYPGDFTLAKLALWNAIVQGGISGDGIVDSGLAGHPNSKIGIAIVADGHGDRSLYMRPTRIGDLNLDGAVTIGDFIDLASHFGSPGSWQEGDLNGDFMVTIGDFIDLASNFGASYSGDITPISPSDAAILADFAAAHGGAPVPEPAVMSLLMPAMLLARRRRRS